MGSGKAQTSRRNTTTMVCGESKFKRELQADGKDKRILLGKIVGVSPHKIPLVGPGKV